MDTQTLPDVAVANARIDEERSHLTNLGATHVPAIAELAATPPAELLALKQRLLITTKALRDELAARHKKISEQAPALERTTEHARAEHSARCNAEMCCVEAVHAEERFVVAKNPDEADLVRESVSNERCLAPALQELAAAHSYFLREWLSVRARLSDAKQNYEDMEERTELEVSEEIRIRAEVKQELIRLGHLEESLHHEMHWPTETRRKAQEMVTEQRCRATMEEASAPEEVAKINIATEARKKLMLNRLESELERISRLSAEAQPRESDCMSGGSEVWQDEAALRFRFGTPSNGDHLAETAMKTQDNTSWRISHSFKVSAVTQFMERSRKSGNSGTAPFGSTSTSPKSANTNATVSTKADQSCSAVASKKLSGTPRGSNSRASNASTGSRGERKPSYGLHATAQMREDRILPTPDGFRGQAPQSVTQANSELSASPLAVKSKDVDTHIKQHHAATVNDVSQQNEMQYPRKVQTTFDSRQDEQIEIDVGKTSSADTANSWRISQVGSLPRSTICTPKYDDGASDASANPTEISDMSSVQGLQHAHTEAPGSPRSVATSQSHSIATRFLSFVSSGRKTDGAKQRAQTSAEALRRKTEVKEKQTDLSMRARSLNPASDRRHWWLFGGQQKDTLNLGANISPRTTASPAQSTSEGSSSGVRRGFRRR